MSRPRRSTTRLAAAVVSGIVIATVGALSATAGLVDDPVEHDAPDPSLALVPMGTYETGIFDESAAEIVAHDPGSQRLFVVNAAQASVEVLDIADPSAPTKVFDLATAGTESSDGSTVPADSVANSVDIRVDGLGAAAVEAPDKTSDGWVVFFDARGDGAALGAIRVGAQPDMLTFTPDGGHLLVANEGEPAEDYAVDPEGSISVIELSAELAAPDQDAATTAAFHEFEEGGAKELPDGVRVYGGREDAGTGTPEHPVSENLEPEYIAVDPAGEVAYVALQEANAMAVLDVASARVDEIWTLGVKDYSQPGAMLDASDRDDAVAIANWPVFGMYQPDAIATYSTGGQTYVVSANEGDSRDWDGYSEEARIKDLGDDGLPPACDQFSELLADESLGRLNITTADGLAADGTCYEELYAYGGRSFSIWNADGEQVFDSGAGFESLLAEANPDFFNSNHSESNFDGRSDDKGPEQEAVTIGQVGEQVYAFVGFERVGGIAVYDITEPAVASFVTYVNNRDFAVSVEDGGALEAAGDLGPEGMTFIPAEESPVDGAPMLVVAHEVSGTTTMFRVDDLTGGDPGDETGNDETGADETGGDESGSDEGGSDEAGGDETGTDDGADESGTETGDDGTETGDTGTPGGTGGADGGAASGTAAGTDDGEPLPDTGAAIAPIAMVAAGLIAGGLAVTVRRRLAVDLSG